MRYQHSTRTSSTSTGDSICTHLCIVVTVTYTYQYSNALLFLFLLSFKTKSREEAKTKQQGKTGQLLVKLRLRECWCCAWNNGTALSPQAKTKTSTVTSMFISIFGVRSIAVLARPCSSCVGPLPSAATLLATKEAIKEAHE
jgi:hypothetical protein